MRKKNIPFLAPVNLCSGRLRSSVPGLSIPRRKVCSSYARMGVWWAWSSKFFFSRRRSAPPSPIRRSGGEKGRNFRQVRQLSFHGSRDALVRSVRSVVVCSSGSAPSLCYCFPCLPGQSLALLRVGTSALPGASCALCVGPLLGPEP